MKKRSASYKHVKVKDVSEMSKYATEYVHRLMKECIEENGNVVIGLSGGSSPKELYQNMAKFKDIDWKDVILLLIDDRFVVPSHKDSNQNLVNETIVKRVPIPEKNVVFPDTTKEEVDDCVEDYERRIVDVLKLNDVLCCDICILGMGGDGHYASLFPPLAEEVLNSEKLVVSTIAPRKFAILQRISTTSKFISKSKNKLFLLKSDKEKKVGEMLKEFSEISENEKYEELLGQKSLYFPVLPYISDDSCTFLCVGF